MPKCVFYTTEQLSSLISEGKIVVHGGPYATEAECLSHCTASSSLSSLSSSSSGNKKWYCVHTSSSSSTSSESSAVSVPNCDNCFIYVDRVTAPADNTTPITVTIHVADASNNPISGVLVGTSWNWYGIVTPGISVTPGTAATGFDQPTDAFGNASWTVVSDHVDSGYFDMHGGGLPECNKHVDADFI